MHFCNLLNEQINFLAQNCPLQLVKRHPAGIYNGWVPYPKIYPQIWRILALARQLIFFLHFIILRKFGFLPGFFALLNLIGHVSVICFFGEPCWEYIIAFCTFAYFFVRTESAIVCVNLKMCGVFSSQVSENLWIFEPVKV